MLSQFRAVVLKEMRESVRIFWKQAVVLFGYALFFQWSAVGKWASLALDSGEPRNAGVAPERTMAITILVVVPMFAQILLSRSLTRERAAGVVATVLATGIPGVLFWSAVAAAAFSCGCPIALLSMAAGYVLVYAHTGFPLAVTSTALWFALTEASLAAVAVVSLTAALYWATRWHDLVVSCLPVMVSLWVFGFCVDHPVPELSLPGTVLVVSVMLLVSAISVLVAAMASRPATAGF
jgi:hypothetical protein